MAATRWASWLAGGWLAGVMASAQSPPAVVPAVEKEVAPVVTRRLGALKKQVMQKLALARRYPGLGKTPVRIRGIDRPWDAMAQLEASGLAVAAAARDRRVDLGLLLDRLTACLGKPAGEDVPLPAAVATDGLDGLAEYITAVLDIAAARRDAALARLSARDRAFMVTWSENLLVNYGPQMPYNARSRPILEKDFAFCSNVWERYDWRQLLAATRVLASFAGRRFIQRVKAACFQAPAVRGKVPGVTGTLYFWQETPHGWLLIGGKGKNTYHLKKPAALIVDLGGDDTYRGRIASSADARRANSVVIDLAGNDTYRADRFGLATGRLGIGLLYDAGGRDTYRLAEASGGVGLGGVGILVDVAGHDVYEGSKFTQGAAVGGLGLVLDRQGNDRHTSHGYALGFGGCAGVGAVIDVEGDDTYQCGRKFPSGYNALEKPPPKPGDARFQWTAFGMGMGLGRRIFGPRDIRDHAHALAGGVGMLIDLAGDDRYDSSNFSQGCGYYFGVGLKLDLAGDDVHGAARYGHAAGAHFGMGLFVDYRGKDAYTSTGPTYNGGCAWDRSIFVCIDGGTEGDRYDLERSAGPGRADIGSWGVFADLGGRDHYRIRSWPGRASRTGIGVFYDRAGRDVYEFLNRKAKKKPANVALQTSEKGGLFWDRK